MPLATGISPVPRFERPIRDPAPDFLFEAQKRSRLHGTKIQLPAFWPQIIHNCPPKAKVGRSNRLGRASDIKYLTEGRLAAVSVLANA